MSRLPPLIAIFAIAACRVEGHYVPLDGAPDGSPEITASWLKHVHGSGREGVSAVALTPDRGVLIAGLFEQTIDLGNGPLAANGVALYIAKFGINGQLIWARSWNSPHFNDLPRESWAAKLRLLPNGDFILAGDFTRSWTLGSTTLLAAGGEDVFVARFSSDGEPIWALSGGSNVYDGVHDVSVDPEGNIAVCGFMFGSGSFFGGPTLTGTSVWLARITSDGDYSWSRAMPEAWVLNPCGVASMPDGDVIYAGPFVGTISVGGAPLTSKSESSIYVVRYGAAEGAHRWSASKGDRATLHLADVEASGASIVLAGDFTGQAWFGGPFLTAQDWDVFVVKLDAANGSHQLSLSMGGPSSDGASHIAVRADGQLTVSGGFTGTADFGGTVLSPTPPYGGGVFAVDLDGSTGTVSSVRSLGAALSELATSTWGLVGVGYFTSPITVLNQRLTPDGGADGYVLVLKR